MTKKPHDVATPRDGSLREGTESVRPLDDTLPPRGDGAVDNANDAQNEAADPWAGAGVATTGERSDVGHAGAERPDPALGNPADLQLDESVAPAPARSFPGAGVTDWLTPRVDPGSSMPGELTTAPVPAAAIKPVRIGRGSRKLGKGWVTAYFAGGIVLLLLGVAAVVVLSVRTYGQDVSEDATVTISRGNNGATVSRSQPPKTPSASPDPARARFGPQRLANGQGFVMTGEDNSKFEITVKAGKFRKTACDAYSPKPEHGGFLMVQLKLKVLEGEPDVSEFAFRFQEPDGSWLPSAYGGSCIPPDEYSGFFRRLSAGRTYTSSILFDVPSKKGDIVFVYPLKDVAASWKMG
ncbi:hypothetical protein [Winogradskya humida]|uniref:DUF4352 domain-containing protein n=1 Tax=Winogradskya humida TaxID=113566 RepID=A0ABQ4A311_9ACTN|nr:hypothetical protein [Actinoplanes humidus]GIE25241.1 hypothetical protein Ahu01nite_083430 [Actinoplanes humidus]